MSSPEAIFPICGALTLLCAYFVWQRVWDKSLISERAIALLLTASIFLGTVALFHLQPITEKSIKFHLGEAVAICTLLVQYIYVIGLLLHGVRGLGLFLLPATAVPLILIPWLPQSPSVMIHTTSPLETGHLLISLAAYAILTLSAFHALMRIILDRALKKKRLNRIAQALPSLYEIEAHMYAQVRWATWLLTLGICTGLVWQWEELTRFKLVSHKILLSLVAWVTLVSLLLLRRRSTWQGKRGSYLVIAAYCLLLLAYFGVKLIQSWIA